MIYVEVAPLSPGVCFICGQADGPFVDLQRDDDDGPAARAGDVSFGNVAHYYVCARCAVSMAQIIAHAVNITVINTDQVDELKARAAFAEGDLAEALASNADLRSAISIVQKAEASAPARDFDVVGEVVDTDSKSTTAEHKAPKSVATKATAAAKRATSK